MTATSDTSATPVITRYDKEGIFYLDITAVSGTNPTLAVTLKTYDPVSAKWYDLASFDSKTGTGSDVGYVEYGLNNKVAAFFVIGGTDTPTFTLTLSVHLKSTS